ncbi:MAG: HAMP domain-containing sensor histidine kinase [Chloroflexota bacterium]|nr:HAMP domain-containing sensor histidine kinase [Chloroflexota bacterium]
MSLRVRIAFLVSGLTALIVLISGAVIHQSTEADLQESLDKKLAFQIERVSDTRNLIDILERQRFFEQRIPPFRQRLTGLANQEENILGSGSRPGSPPLNCKPPSPPLGMVEFPLQWESLPDCEEIEGVASNSLIDVQIPTLIKIDDDRYIVTDGYPNLPAAFNNDGFIDVEVGNETWRVLTKSFEVVDPFIRRELEIRTRMGTLTLNRAGKSEGQENILLPTHQFVVQTAVKRDSVTDALQDFRKSFVAVGIFSVLVAGLSGWFIGGTILNPLGRLGRQARNLGGSGDLSTRVNSGYGPPEVEALANEINEMLSRLEASANETEEALRSSRLFASNVAHELRTPLTSIRTNLELLNKHSDMGKRERSEILASVIDQQGLLLNTLESLRLLARGDLSEKDVFEEIDFAQLIQSIVNRLEQEESGINIDIYLPSDPPLILGWHEGLMVLFRNILENARTHGKAQERDLRVEIFAETLGTELKVRIEDNGIGIPESEKAEVMKRFIKGSNSSSSGSGLGLSLAKQQAEIHGGTIELSDNQPEGTRVSISLPVVIT